MKPAHLLPLSLFCYCFFCSAVFAQNSEDSLYESFDGGIGKENLGINNGTIHLNNFRSADNTNRYYNTDKYVTGNIVYDGQPYTAIALKYDLVNDVVVAKISGENNMLGVNLIAEKTEHFYLNGKKFTNLSLIQKNPNLQGFYEDENISSSITFYTKYKKENIEVLRNNGVFYTFSESNSFAFNYNGDFYRLAYKSDVIGIFADFEKEIDAFYKKNAALENTSKQLFYRTLLKNISLLLPNKTN